MELGNEGFHLQRLILGYSPLAKQKRLASISLQNLFISGCETLINSHNFKFCHRNRSFQLKIRTSFLLFSKKKSIIKTT